jgi:hypothetical protein
MARVHLRPWWWVAGFAVLLAVAAALTYFAGVPADGLDRADKIASVGSLITGTAALLVSVVALRLGLRQASPAAAHQDDGSTARATHDLAATLGRQWRREASLRHLQRPQPLRVRWSTTPRPVAAPAGAVLGPDAVPGRPTRLRLRGDVDEVLDLFHRLPARQLVVLGEPGAGKTALVVLLTLSLLDARQPGEPVAVLLSMSHWDPHAESLDAWVARRLVEEYPALGNAAVYGARAAERLVREGRIIPILDGLDELTVTSHPAALAKVDEACAEGRPLVLTSRSADYEQAVTASGEFLRRAAVVELEPVGVGETIAFIAAAQVAGDDRWGPVFDHLRAAPDGALARALSTPLMVQLARVAYARLTTSPAELCDPVTFPDREAIEEHLLDSYLGAAYSAAPYRPDQAGVWLTFLARHLRRLRTHDLAWWHLDRTVPRFLFGLVTGLTGGGAVTLVVLGATGLPTAPAFGFCGGLTAGTVWWLARRHRLPRLRTRALRPLGHLATGVVLGLATGLLVARGGGLAAGLVLGSAGGCAQGLVAGIFGGYGALRPTPLDEIKPLSPRSVLVAARTASLRQTLAATVIGCVGAVAAMSLVVGPSGPAALTALGMGAVGGLAVGLDTPSGRFLLARAYLWRRARLPRNLMAFLEDAHQRGVLRQAGAVYQFRHARLRDRLADHTARGSAVSG